MLSRFGDGRASWNATNATRRFAAMTAAETPALWCGRAALLLSVAMTLTACASPDDSRLARVTAILQQDNWAFALRDPARVAMKLRKMQRSWFEWTRGTLSVFWADHVAEGAAYPASVLAPAGSAMWILGDPHIENLGTFYQAGGAAWIDWNDFDAAGFGPAWIDLRRLALSLWVAAADANTGRVPEALGRALCDAVVTGYIEALARAERGVPQTRVAQGVHPVFDALLKKAAKDGDRRKRLNEVPPLVNGERVMATGALSPMSADGVVENELQPLAPERASNLRSTVESWQRALPAARAAQLGRLRGARARFGAGVASYASERWYLWFAGPSDNFDDDVLLEWKEVRDGVLLALPNRPPNWPWAHNGERVVGLAQKFLAFPTADDFFASVHFGGLPMRSQSRTGYQRGLELAEVAALAQDPGTHGELLQLATLCGGLLAAAHVRANNASAIADLALAMRTHEHEFRDETALFVAQYALRSWTDYVQWRTMPASRILLAGEEQTVAR